MLSTSVHGLDACTHMSTATNTLARRKNEWRSRASIHVPLTCKVSALPYELHPQLNGNAMPKCDLAYNNYSKFRECKYGAAGRLLNALRQECVHQLGTPMDNLRLVTAWDRSRLQVSKFEAVDLMLASQCACTTLRVPVLHPLSPSNAAAYGTRACCSPYVACQQNAWANHASLCVLCCHAGFAVSHAVKHNAPRSSI